MIIFIVNNVKLSNKFVNESQCVDERRLYLNCRKLNFSFLVLEGFVDGKFFKVVLYLNCRVGICKVSLLLLKSGIFLYQNCRCYMSYIYVVYNLLVRNDGKSLE